MRIWMAFFVAVLAACGRPDQASPEAATPMPTGPLGDAVTPLRYTVDLTIVPEQDDFSGYVAIDVEIAEPARVIWLHGRELDVEQVWVESADARIEARYRQADDSGIARLTLAETPAAGPARLHFVYTAPFNQSLEGLYKVTEDGDDYVFTQFQPISARLVFPGFDEPAFKTPFDISITAREEHTAITATPEVSAETRGNGMVTRRFATTPPLPTYLIAFAVGPLDVVEWEPLPPTAVRDRPLPLRGVAARGKGEQLDFALANTQRLVEALEDYFDIAFPYPKLDIIAAPDFAFGAMENVGAIVYREQYLLLDDDASAEQKRSYAFIHAHELAHQWFGNLVTPRWWDDIWLNESFATWIGNKAAHIAFPDLGFANHTFRGALGVMNADALSSARQIRQPIESNHDIASAFDGITYNKGGAVLAMFEAWLGEETFREGVRLHMRRFEHGVADVDDFMQSLADGAEREDVVDAFRSFLFQPGLPLVSATLDCAEETPAVALSQRRYLPLGSEARAARTWQVPVCMAWDDGERGRHCILLQEREARVELPARSCPAWLLPNDNGAGYYRFTLDDTGTQRLLAHFDQLNEREAQSLMDSLSSGWRAGRVATATLVDAMRQMAQSSHREVAMAPVSDLFALRDHLVYTEAARTGVRNLARQLYAARLEEIGLDPEAGEDPETALLRTELVEALALLARDTALREALAGRASAWLDGEGDALTPGLVEAALTVAVEEGGAGFAERLLEHTLDSRDGMFRQRALRALAAAPQDDVAATMREQISDPRLRDNEASMIPFVQGDAPAQREALWDWVREDNNLDALLARVPVWRQGNIANFANGFCSNERAEEVEKFFQARVENLQGGPRALAQTTERIRLCAAMRAEVAGEATALFDPGGER